MNKADRQFLREAYRQARQGYDEGGAPIGAVMVRNNEVIARGRNRRVQQGDPVMHGETDCLRNAGILYDYRQIDLYTTLSPCMMCAGAILHFGIPRVVVGEDRNFAGNIRLLRDHGVEVVLADDEDCRELMARFIAERPDIWFEDIAGNEKL